MFKSRCLASASSAALVVSGMLLAVPLKGWAQMEEIVVTTRKKSENLQDVPIAVDAISAEMIQRRGITSISDVTKMSPSVQFDQSYGPADVRIAVRGLSNTRGKSNVAFLVDGVDTTTENFVSAGSGLLATQRLLVDVESIEVVKGPQSALYGRSAFAGAISYRTMNPGDELEGVVRVEAGDYGLMQVDGAIGGPIKGLEDQLGMRLSGAYWTRDGYYTNSVSGGDLGGEEGFGGALTTVWEPTDAARVRLRTEYSDSKFGQRPNIRIGSGTTGQNLALAEYPSDAIAINPATGEPALGAGSATATGLLDFGQYCPPELKDSSKGPGYCLATSFGSAGNLQPTLSEDPVTGQDYKGTESQLWRTTLQATMDYDFGTFSSITGFTDYSAFDELDQDYQALGRPDQLTSGQQGRSNVDTDQFSQEFRFQSTLDAPINYTLGAQYWTEDRKQSDQNFIVSCIENGKIVDTSPGWQPGTVWPEAFVSGICDGVNGTITTWQERALDMYPCEYDANGNPVQDPSTGTCVQAGRTGAQWRAETEHLSAYLQLNWALSDTWELELEDRYVEEDFNLLRPNFSSCTHLGFPFATTPFVPLLKEGPVVTGADDIVCASEARTNPNVPAPPPDANGNDWSLIEGSTSSSYHTPKVTVRWSATDDQLVYFSWARGKKPGGINTLAAGGTATTITNELFKPEVVDAWEIGYKSSWEAAGDLRVNGAFFFNDYTDKQIGTQVSVESPAGSGQFQLQPRVVNAAAAEVWGLELETNWYPSFADGLLLSISYTYLDATFVEFFDDTRSLQRAAANQQCNLVYLDDQKNVVPPTAAGAQATCRLNLSGNRLERTPEHAAVGNVAYTHQFMDSGFDYFLELTGTYEGERVLDADNNLPFDDYLIWDTRIGISGDKWEALFYVNNILEDDTIQTGGSGPDFAKQVTELGFTGGLGVSHYFAGLPDPRTFGAKITMRF